MNDLLEVAGLTIGTRRGRPLVLDANLSIAPGEIVGLVGESGCGKTTLCRSIAALLADNLAVQSGKILLSGQDVTHLRPSAVHRLRPHGVAMVFQDPLAALSPVMRVGDQIVEAFLARQRMNRSTAHQQASALLDRMGLANAVERMHDFPHQLSGGQRQRVMLAMAIASDPALLLADEPTSAVDVSTQAQVLHLLTEIAAERNIGVLLVSHNYAVVSQVCSRAAVMYRGRIVEQGDTARVMNSPAHPYTRALIGSLPSVHERRDRLPVIPSALRDSGAVGACPFYPRCTHAQELPCSIEYEPQPRAIEGSHLTACVREPVRTAVSYERGAL